MGRSLAGALLGAIVRLLVQIDAEPTNKMTTAAIAKLMAPALFGDIEPPSDASRMADFMAELQAQEACIHTLMSHCDDCFVAGWIVGQRPAELPVVESEKTKSGSVHRRIDEQPKLKQL